MTEKKQVESQLSPAAAQAIGKLSMRVNDLLDEINRTLKVFGEENAALRSKVLELQAPVKEKTKP